MANLENQELGRFDRALEVAKAQALASEVHYVRGRLDPDWYWPASPRELALREIGRREFAEIMRGWHSRNGRDPAGPLS